jgi:hypothetical protein
MAERDGAHSSRNRRFACVLAKNARASDAAKIAAPGF